MRTWIYAMMVVAAGALVGCDGGGDGKGGNGGTPEGGGGEGGTTTTGSGTTMMTTSSTTTSTPTAKDCTAEATFGDCFDCFAEDYPDGAMVYNDLVVCAVCTACYTTCDGAGSGCPMPPAMKDACDGDAADPAACNQGMSSCIACSVQGTCNPQYTACFQDSQDCADFADALMGCPN